jgi:hypothetical protein
MLRAFCFFLTPLALCLACVGCRKDEPSPTSTAPPAGVTRCLHGIERALKATTVSETSKIYYEECADLFSDASCRDGWRAAAPAEPSAQLGIVADACKKSYCPALGAFAFAICKDDFVSTPQSLARDWPPLFDAIVAREAGMSATEVSTALLAVYAHAAVLAAQSAAASASVGAPPASGSAAPPGPSAAPAASASGAPPTSSGKAAAAPAKAVPPGPAPVPHPSAR